MGKRIAFALVTGFWLVMNVLLWQAEFSGKSRHGNPVPVGMVWEKMLTAPDDSALEILHRGRKIGYCRWLPNIGEETRAGKVASEEHAPEGSAPGLSSYTVDLEGTFVAPDLGGRFRFDFHGVFSTDHEWRELRLLTVVRPSTWQLSVSAKQRKLTIKVDDLEGRWEKTYSFDEFRNPGKVLEDLGVALPPGLLGATSDSAGSSEPSIGITWTARNDWLRIGRSQVRVYRLECRLVDRLSAEIYLSRVGEILKVQLPFDIVLANDAILNL